MACGCFVQGILGSELLVEEASAGKAAPEGVERWRCPPGRRLVGSGHAWPSNERRWGAGKGTALRGRAAGRGRRRSTVARGGGTRSWPAPACCLGRDARAEGMRW